MSWLKKLTIADIELHNQRVRVGGVVAKVRPPNMIKARESQLFKSPKKPLPRKRELAYNPKVVTAFFAEHGIPEPEFEYQFHDTRLWRFDLAWPFFAQVGHTTDELGGLALEIDGGIWIQGGHNRGAQIKATWEKENEANIMGWAILKCEPSELCMDATAQLIKRALKIT